MIPRTAVTGAVMERHQRILDEMEQCGACSYQDLSTLLGVSIMTIRRDIDRLASAGGVIKTLGGAQKAHAPRDLYESAVTSRLSEHSAEKKAIARRAMELVAPGQTLFLDGSTTCLELAKLLASEGNGLTVITHSALACMELGRSGRISVIGIGGQFDPRSLCFVGPASEESAANFFVDMAFVSTKGFIPGEGTFESEVGNLRIKRTIAEHAEELALLVDHSKFGRRALCKVLEPSQIDIVVTDGQAPEKALADLQREGKRVLVASGGRSPGDSVR